MKNKREHIDNLYSESFEGYRVKPSKNVWKGIVSNYLNPPSGKPGWMKIIFLITAAALIVATTLIIVIPKKEKPVNVSMDNEIISTSEKAATPLNSKDVPENNVPVQKASLKQSSPESPDLTKEKSIHVNDYEHNKIKPAGNKPLSGETSLNRHETGKNISPDPENKKIAAVQDYPSGPEKGISEIASDMVNDHPGSPDSDQKNKITGYNGSNHAVSLMLVPREVNMHHHAKGMKISRIKTNLWDPLPFNLDFQSSPMHYRTSSPLNSIQWENDYARMAEISLGFSFTPEYIFYNEESKEVKNSYYLDLLLQYQRGSFLIRTGLGAGRSEDNGDYTIRFDTYDSIGYYYKVSSFTVVPGYPDSIIFNTVVENVYDSISHTEQQRPENFYTYLQIPLSIGYTLSEFRRWSFTLTGGPVVSFLVSSNEKQVTFYDPGASNIIIEDQTPARVKTSWQFMLNLGIHYMVTDRTSLMLEPTYRQYLKTIYTDNNQSRPPYSFGLRAGLLFTF